MTGGRPLCRNCNADGVPACESCGSPSAAAQMAQQSACSAPTQQDEVQQVVEIVRKVLANQNFH